MSDYTRGLYHQLEDVITRLDSLQLTLEKERTAHKEELSKILDDHKSELSKLRIENRSQQNKLLEEIQKLNAELAEANRVIQLLKEENERLKRKDNNDSSNSSNPPSSDGPGKRANTYNGRKKSENSKGAQPGHKGTTLKKKDVEQKIADGSIRHEVINMGSGGGKYISKYVLDFEVNVVAKEYRFYPDENGKYNIPAEYRSDVIYGNNIKSAAVEMYCEDVVANDKIAEFLNSLTHNKLNISTGSVYNFIRTFSEKAEDAIETIRNKLLDSDVVYTDATSTSMNGKEVYIRNHSTNDAVLYCPMYSKSKSALASTEVLNKFAGILVHDHETVMYHFGTGHSECNAHILRYLKKNSEETGNKWSKDMASFLAGINNAKKAAVTAGKTGFSDVEYERYSNRYNEIIAEGRKQKGNTRGTIAYREETALINRMEKYKDAHLMFAKNFKVDFTNNLSERDLRICKNRDKMSGGFRDRSGHEMYCRILSVLRTCKRQNLDILNSIASIYKGQSVLL